MAFRNIYIVNPAKIFIRNQQLIIATDKEHSVAIEDISCLLIENMQVTITAATLSKLGQCGCTVLVCDDKHIPCAVLTPYMQYIRSLGIINKQLGMSEPQKKKLWQKVIETKIENQGKCLALCNHMEEAKYLYDLSRRVSSGDTENVEATAAQYYFKNLFGEKFYRDYDCFINSALNYGYAIIRGCVARCLASYGYITALGIHHRSGVNPFNLADDIMEPFRPLIDLIITQNHLVEDENEILQQKHKQELFNSLNMNMEMNGKKYSTSNTIEKAVQSLTRCIEEGHNRIVLPSLVAIEQHQYE